MPTPEGKKGGDSIGKPIDSNKSGAHKLHHQGEERPVKSKERERVYSKKGNLPSPDGELRPKNLKNGGVKKETGI